MIFHWEYWDPDGVPGMNSLGPPSEENPNILTINYILS